MILNFQGQLIDVEGQLLSISKAECEESLAEFIRQSWHIIEPGAQYIHGWHIDFICEHLEAITLGDEIDEGVPYNRLLVNVPPGTMKSLVTNVFWPAWEWGPCNMAHLRYVCASHSQDLAVRDGLRMRRLITSEWYQARWGDRVTLTGDQNQKTKFENTATGFRQAAAAGSITGARGDRVVIDDPHSVEGAGSDAMRRSTVDWFLEAVPTRLNNPKKSAIVVIMQRLHEEDVSGVILDKDLGYDHIMLPMRYDPTRHCVTKLGIEDPRTADGELLFPDRFPLEVVDRDERVMGPYAVAGQFQQQPTPRGGGVIKADWWQPWDADAYPPMDYVIASLDTAYTTKQENDFSALTVWGVFSSDTSVALANKVAGRDGVAEVERTYVEGAPRVMLMAAWQERIELSDLIEKVANTCRRMRVDKLLIESKAAGISVAQELRRLYGSEDWGVQLVNPGSIDKLARLYSVQHLFSEGLVYAPDRGWADTVIRQCEVFPKGKHDDLCLVAGTLVTMADGSQKPIENIVVGDCVATPNGSQLVSASAFTGIRPIWRLEHQFGSLEGTGNHPVWASGRWIELEKLCPNDTLTMYHKERQSSWLSKEKKGSLLRQWSSMAIDTIDTLSQKTRLIGDTLRGRAIAFIGTFGSFIMAPFRRDIKSTMLMATPATMTSQTLSAFHFVNTGQGTATSMSSEGGLKSSSLICDLFKEKQRNGTRAQKGASGIGRMLSRHCGGTARPNHTAKAATKARACGADLGLWQRALESCFARLAAQRKSPSTSEVCSVRFTHTMQPVFNLTVDGEHCYYANGVLTHNCDTVSMGLRHLRELGLLSRASERSAEIEDQLMHRGGPPAPLYPV